MFHAPTTESKQQNDPSRKQPTAEHERILSPHVPVVAGQFGLGAGGSVPPGSPLSSQPQLARLHRTYGNQAVLRMLSRSAPTIQTKLTVNQPGDQYEQEADRVSERVMCMPAPVPMSSSASDEIAQRKCNACAQEEEQHTVRRKCESCAEEDKKKKKEEETHEKLSRKESGGAAALDGTSAPAIVAKVLQSSGQPLDAATRAFFEPRFGHDFSRVRVHMDAQASASARAIHAQAYTVGQDMVFREGAFSCGAAEGRRLLAHELTHVVQQSGAGGAVQRRLEVEREAALAGPVDPQQEPVPADDKPKVPGAPPSKPTPTNPPCLPVITAPTWDVAPKPILVGSGPCDLRLSKALATPGSAFGVNGMEFKGTVSIPVTCPGKVYFVQYAKPNRSEVSCSSPKEGKPKETGLCINPGLGLDTSWPYNNGSVVNTDQNAGSTVPFNTVDSPGWKNISDPWSARVRICIEDSFTTYIVFEDKAGTLTSLGWMSWSYTAHAERDSGTCPVKTTSNDCAGWTVTGTGKKDNSDFSVGASAPAQALDRSVPTVIPSSSDCAPTGCPKAVAEQAPTKPPAE